MKRYLERALALKLELQGVSSGSIYTSIDSVARAVESERPAITIHPAPDGTVTIMFSDIEDSTVLTERLGDQAWQELLQQAQRPHPRAAPGARGLRSEDDGRRLHGRLPVREEGPRLRHRHPARLRRTTTPLRRASDVKVRASASTPAKRSRTATTSTARTSSSPPASPAKPIGGEILVSSLLRSARREQRRTAAMFGEPREVELKGLAGTHTIHAVRWTP